MSLVTKDQQLAAVTRHFRCHLGVTTGRYKRGYAHEGTGYALADWLVTKGITPQFVELPPKPDATYTKDSK